MSPGMVDRQHCILLIIGDESNMRLQQYALHILAHGKLVKTTVALLVDIRVLLWHQIWEGY